MVDSFALSELLKMLSSIIVVACGRRVMRIRFWLLDVNYEVKNDSSEVRLWGVDEVGRRVVVIDRNFLPYFYATIEEGADSSEVVEESENNVTFRS
jgi:hypothetical protein